MSWQDDEIVSGPTVQSWQNDKIANEDKIVDAPKGIDEFIRSHAKSSISNPENPEISGDEFKYISKRKYPNVDYESIKPEFDKQAKAYKVANILASAPPSRTLSETVASQVPESERQLVAQSLAELASEKKTAQKKSFLKRAFVGTLSSAVDLGGEMADVAGFGLDAKTTDYAKQLLEIKQSNDPLVNYERSFLHPAEAVVRAGEALPKMYAATQLVGAAPESFIPKATAGFTPFAKGSYDAHYDAAIKHGLNEDQAGVAAGLGTVIEGAIFGGIAEKFIPKLGGTEKAVSGIRSVIYNYVKNAGEVTGLMASAGSAGELTDQLSKWAAGKGAPDFGAVLAKTLSAAKEGAPIALGLAIPRATGEALGVADQWAANKHQQINEKQILEWAGAGTTPGREPYKRVTGDYEKTDRATRRENVQKLAEDIKLREFQKQFAIEPKQPEVPSEVSREPRPIAPVAEPAATEQTAPIEQPKLLEQPPSEVQPEVQPAQVPAKAPEVVGIANELTNELRVKRGDSPLETTSKRPWSELLSTAEDKISKDPTLPERTIKDLETSGRPHTDEEVAVLSIHKRKLENSLADATNKLLESQQSPDASEQVKAQADANFILEKIRDVELVSRPTGTETARALNARKILLNEDFSLGNILSRSFIKKGEPLTPEETANIAEISKSIQGNEALAEKYKSGELTPESPRLKSFAKKDAAKKAVDVAWVEFKAAMSGKPKEGLVTGEGGALNFDVAASGLKLAKAYGKLGIATVEDFLIKAKEVLGNEFDKHKDMLTASWNKYMDSSLESRIKRTSAGLDRSIAKLESDLAEGKIGFNKKVEPISTPEIDAKRERLNELKEMRDKLREETGITEERKNETYKKSLEKRLAEYDRKIKENDFSEPKRKEKILNDELTDLKFKIEQAKIKYRTMQEKWEKDQRSALRKTLGLIPEVGNAARAIMTSIDLSGLLRQGGFAMFSHPARTSEAIPDMFKAFWSEKSAFQSVQEIADRPYSRNGYYKKGKLGITTTEGPIATNEEVYMGSLLQRLAYANPRNSVLKGLLLPAKLGAKVVVASERAYVTVLNRIRADSFDTLVNTLSKTGKPTDVELLAIGNFVNASTGRANVGEWEQASTNFAQAFFAPRFTVSRFQLVLGQPMWKGTARTRVYIAKEYGRYLMGIGTFYGMAAMAFGDQIRFEFDPRSSDFGKIIFKDGRRLDILSGLSQITTVVSRLGLGSAHTLGLTDVGAIKKPTGEIVHIGEGWSTPKASDVIARFLRGKLAPVPGAILDITEGTNLVGEETTPLKAATKMSTPLSFGDIYDVLHGEGNIPQKTALSLLVIMGMGAQNYQNATPEMFAHKISEHPVLKGFNEKTNKPFDYTETVDQVVAQAKKNKLTYKDMAEPLIKKLVKEGVGDKAINEALDRLGARLNRQKK